MESHTLKQSVFKDMIFLVHYWSPNYGCHGNFRVIDKEKNNVNLLLYKKEEKSQSFRSQLQVVQKLSKTMFKRGLKATPHLTRIGLNFW